MGPVLVGIPGVYGGLVQCWGSSAGVPLVATENGIHFNSAMLPFLPSEFEYAADVEIVSSHGNTVWTGIVLGLLDVTSQNVFVIWIGGLGGATSGHDSSLYFIVIFCIIQPVRSVAPCMSKSALAIAAEEGRSQPCSASPANQTSIEDFPNGSTCPSGSDVT